MLEKKSNKGMVFLQLNKLKYNEIRNILKKLKNDFLKNYDLIWLLEQSMSPGNWEVFGQENFEGFMIKRSNMIWLNPNTGQELETYYKYTSRTLPVYIHCYKPWVSQYIAEKHYKFTKGENIYFHCDKEGMKCRKRTAAKVLTYAEVSRCNEQWFSPELLDFLKQGQNVYGIIEEDLLVGWCFIDTLTKGIAEVYKIEIHPMRRRRGFAIDILSRAMLDIFDNEEYVVFNVSSQNQEAISFITKLGFKELEREFRFYLSE